MSAGVGRADLIVLPKGTLASIYDISAGAADPAPARLPVRPHSPTGYGNSAKPALDRGNDPF